ncbi:hypothetical protein [Agrococcus jejuensis]|nr:hypothetical protein [Agrococcus jejuensis]
MRDALQHPDARAAVACYAAVVAAGLFAMAVMPRDGWLSIAPMVVVVVAGLVVGTALLVRAGLRGAPRGQLVAIAASAAGAAVLAVVVAFGAILGMSLVLGFPIVLAIVAAIALVLTGRGVPPYAPVRWASVAAGTGASLALVGLGVADALVWLPETLVPGATAAEVHAALAAAGETDSHGLAVMFAVMWGASTLVVAAVVLWRRLRPGASLAWTLAPGVLAIMGLPWWQFGLGMDIADTLVTSGGMSWAMPWLAAASCVAAGVATFAVLRDRAPIASAAAVTA